MRGTWQGSGTWQTSGLDVGGLVAAGAAIAAACWAAEVVLQLLWYLAAFLGAAIVGTVLALVAMQRRYRQHAAMLEATRAARLEAVRPRPRVSQDAPPSIVNNYGPQIHVYGDRGEQAAARIIRQAIPGTAGDPDTEGKR